MKALVIVDVQNDFLPGGALAVPEGDKIIPVINQLSRISSWFNVVVATQDWHPRGHKSFASAHGKPLFEKITLNGLEQILWPDHCVQGGDGAKVAQGLDTSRISHTFQKGSDPEVDSYSGFFDNGQRHSTGMGEWLKKRGVTDLVIVGLATDFCVKWTALDALRLGFKTIVVRDACRAVVPDHEASALKEVADAGGQIVASSAIAIKSRILR